MDMTRNYHSASSVSLNKKKCRNTEDIKELLLFTSGCVLKEAKLKRSLPHFGAQIRMRGYVSDRQAGSEAKSKAPAEDLDNPCEFCMTDWCCLFFTTI